VICRNEMESTFPGCRYCGTTANSAKNNKNILNNWLSGFLIFINVYVEIPYVRPWRNGGHAAGRRAGVGAGATAPLPG